MVATYKVWPGSEIQPQSSHGARTTRLPKIIWERPHYATNSLLVTMGHPRATPEITLSCGPIPNPTSASFLDPSDLLSQTASQADSLYRVTMRPKNSITNCSTKAPFLLEDTMMVYCRFGCRTWNVEWTLFLEYSCNWHWMPFPMPAMTHKLIKPENNTNHFTSTFHPQPYTLTYLWCSNWPRQKSWIKYINGL